MEIKVYDTKFERFFSIVLNGTCKQTAIFTTASYSRKYSVHKPKIPSLPNLNSQSPLYYSILRKGC